MNEPGLKDPCLQLLFILLLFVFYLVMGEGSPQSYAVDKPSESQAEAAGKQLQPMAMTSESRVYVESARRRMLKPFRTCSTCICCDQSAVRKNCAYMNCCFGIDCQLPNKPYGVCAFVPQTCNCTSCDV